MLRSDWLRYYEAICYSPLLSPCYSPLLSPLVAQSAGAHSDLGIPAFCASPFPYPTEDAQNMTKLKFTTV